MDEIKIVRLKNNEDILSMVSENCEKVFLNNPLYLTYKTVDAGSILLLTPWLPIEYIKENSVSIDKSEILFILEPSIKMINIYMKTLISLYDNTLGGYNLSFHDKIYNDTIH